MERLLSVVRRLSPALIQGGMQCFNGHACQYPKVQLLLLAAIAGRGCGPPRLSLVSASLLISSSNVASAGTFRSGWKRTELLTPSLGLREAGCLKPLLGRPPGSRAVRSK